MVAKKKKVPWWSSYEDEDIVAIDLEMVTKRNQEGKFRQHPASVDIVSMTGGPQNPYYSTLVQHAKGSFNATRLWKDLTGFKEDSFSSKTLPTEEEVRKQVEAKLSGKLVVTVGGGGDFLALGLEMADFDVFDLQSHFFNEKENEHGISVREGHSLRSLSAYYLKEGQGSRHTSLKDALMTMELFKIYKQVKIDEDEENCEKRINISKPYYKIPVVPNPLKNKYKKKK